jgi:FKBP-type peptidyl-prolyl cis-trans isomerase
MLRHLAGNVMTFVRRIVPLILLAFTVAACGGSEDPTTPTQPSTPPPQGPATLQITELTTGEGAEASGTRSVVVHYTLWLFDPAGADSRGTRIESSRDAGRQPFSFRMGTNGVIPGFEQGVSGMRVGGTRRIIVPPSLAYGATGNGPIAPNSWIVFEIELLAAVD